MAEITGISWCDATINFWHGCHKVSEGCKYCYMFRDKARFEQEGDDVRKTSAGTIKRILQDLNRQRIERKFRGIDDPLKIFTCSWSDFFLEDADAWRSEAWDIIRANPDFVWIILTKRIDRVSGCLPADWGNGWPNVWLLVSAENQARYNERVPLLLNTPAAIRGVSCEPLLSEIDLTVPNGDTFRSCLADLDWIIIGGESGNDTGKWLYRPAEVGWIRSMVDQCESYEVPVFVKQLGTSIAKDLGLKNRAGEKLEEWPSNLNDLKLQLFPC